MDARIIADFGNDCGDSAGNDVLRIRLSRIDNVVDRDAAAKVWAFNAGFRLSIRIRGCDPQHVAIRIGANDVVMKIETELAEFPKLIGDVFASVRYGAVRADDDLV